MNEIDYYIEKVNKSNGLTEDKKKYYKELIYQIDTDKYPVILNSFHLSNLCGLKWNIIKNLINNNVDCYHKFYITKKDRVSKREILAPSKELSHVQKYIKESILDNVTISDSCYGFVKGRNIKDNASEHLNSEVVLNIDLKDFFPSVSSDRVYFIFNKICKYDKNLSYCLTKLVTYRNVLPQGACTSPIIANIVSYKLDLRLSNLAEKMNIIYTRYADDITFSGDKKVVNKKLFELLKRIIEDEGFYVNNKKVHFSYNFNRQEVTGLTINDGKVSANSKYIRKIRQELYYIKKYGLENHLYITNTRNSFFLEHLKGKIMFVRDIDKEKGNELLDIYNDLSV